jgi:hypothetical protein
MKTMQIIGGISAGYPGEIMLARADKLDVLPRVV